MFSSVKMWTVCSHQSIENYFIDTKFKLKAFLLINIIFCWHLWLFSEDKVEWEEKLLIVQSKWTHLFFFSRNKETLVTTKEWNQKKQNDNGHFSIEIELNIVIRVYQQEWCEFVWMYEFLFYGFYRWCGNKFQHDIRMKQNDVIAIFL